MAEAHEGWLASMPSGLSEDEVEQPKYLLGKAKQSVVYGDGKEESR